MNPLLEKALGSIARWALTLCIPALVSSGIWTSEEAAVYVAAAATALLALGWSFWEKYSSQLHLVTALAMPKNSTQAEVDTRVKAGDTPPAALAKDDKPL